MTVPRSESVTYTFCVHGSTAVPCGLPPTTTVATTVFDVDVYRVRRGIECTVCRVATDLHGGCQCPGTDVDRVDATGLAVGHIGNVSVGVDDDSVRSGQCVTVSAERSPKGCRQVRRALALRGVFASTVPFSFRSAEGRKVCPLVPVRRASRRSALV